MLKLITIKLKIIKLLEFTSLSDPAARATKQQADISLQKSINQI